MHPLKKFFFQIVAVFILSNAILYVGLKQEATEEPGTVWLTIGDITFRGPVSLQSSPVQQPDGSTVYTITTPKYDIQLSANPR